MITFTLGTGDSRNHVAAHPIDEQTTAAMPEIEFLLDVLRGMIDWPATCPEDFHSSKFKANYEQ